MPFTKGDININRNGRTPITLGGSPNKLYGTRKWVQTTLEGQRDKVEKAWFEDKLEDPANLFLDAFAWHWHNSSNKNKNIVEGSKFDLLDKLTDKKLQELNIL